MTPRAWVLNLDAELELARPRGYTPSARVRALVRTHRTRALHLLGPDDVLVEEDTRLPPELRGIPGCAFCPTPRARALLEAAGAVPEPAPALEILRVVNDRRFCAALGQELPGAVFVDDLGALLATIADPSVGEGWLLKRSFGTAGRERRRVPARPADAATEAWANASFRLGGVQVEPCVRPTVEYVTHGYVEMGGRTFIGVPAVQECDLRGVWQRTRPLLPGELSSGEALRLRETTRRAAEALAEAGYFGPFGMDGYRYEARLESGFVPVGDINARYPMGWTMPASSTPVQ